MAIPKISGLFFFLSLLTLSPYGFGQQHAADRGETYTKFHPGQTWKDDRGNHINAHGAGILFYEGTYYLYGERRGQRASEGVNVYSSQDLYNWKFENHALQQVSDSTSPITKGSIIERPKVIYNAKTEQFVMYFHLELKGQGYGAAQRGIAVSDSPRGDFKFVKAGRVNPGVWPENMTDDQRNVKADPKDVGEWWTPEWRKAVENGLFVRRDYKGGQMARDMTLYVDKDSTAYHVYASEENLTLHIAQLTDDYMDYTGKYVRAIPGGHYEAPAIFERNGTYFMVVSSATGWKPNKATLLKADHLLGEWKRVGDFTIGEGSELTFRSQSTYVLQVEDTDRYIYMGDRWNPNQLNDSRYIWLPIQWKENQPTIEWQEEWGLNDG